MGRLGFRPFSLSLLWVGGLILLGACSADPWVPDGGWQKAPQKGELGHCDNFYLQQLLLDDSAQNPVLQAQLLKEFLNKCEPQLSREAPGYYKQLAASIQIVYDIEKNPARRDVSLNVRSIDLGDFQTVIAESPSLEPGRMLIRGKLFFKSDPQPRPLVIVKCGLQCDFSSSTLKFLVSLLFDEGPFHLLVLPSITSESFQIDNGLVSLGGFDEGRQILAVAKFVQSPEFPLSDRISRVHVAGISLGGHAALYSALYNSHNLRADGQGYISSVFAGCPVVNLKDSIEALYDGSFLGGIFSDLFWDQMKLVSPFVPILGDFLSGLGGDYGLPIPEALSRIVTPYYQDVTSKDSWAYRPMDGYVVNDAQDFWRFNDFSRFAELNTTPTFIWASKDDEIVEAKRNTQLILNKFGKNIPPNYRILVSEKGYHCGFTDAYTWRVAGVALRSVLISQSPELKNQQRTLLKDIAYKAKGPDFSKGKIYREGLKWRASPGQSSLKLVHDLSEYCDSWWSRCALHQESEIPLSVFGMDSNLTPKIEVEAQALTRWFNANVYVSGENLGWLGRREEPKYVSWTIYGEPGVGPLYSPVPEIEFFDLTKAKLAPALEPQVRKQFLKSLLRDSF